MLISSQLLLSIFFIINVKNDDCDDEEEEEEDEDEEDEEEDEEDEDEDDEEEEEDEDDEDVADFLIGILRLAEKIGCRNFVVVVIVDEGVVIVRDGGGV